MNHKKDCNKVIKKPFVRRVKDWLRTGSAVRQLVSLFLLTVPAVGLFLLPLLQYNEYSLAGNESLFLFSVSLGAWRDLGVSALSIWVGVKLWRHGASAEKSIRTFFHVVIASALALLVFSLLNPQASCFHREIRITQAWCWLESIILCAIVHGGLLLARRQEYDKGYAAETKPACLTWPVQAGLAGVIILGSCLALAAPRIRPKDVFEAAWRGDAVALREFLKVGADANDADRTGSSLLHYAHSKEAAAALLAEHSRKEETYLLTPLDLKEVAGLVAKLRNPQDGVAAYLREKLLPEVRDDVDRVPDGNQVPLSLVTALVDNVNNVLRGNSLWDASRFKRVNISDELRWLCAQSTIGIERTRLNRLLLEAAFPAEIVRYQVDWRNHLAETPLHWAAQNNCPGVAAFLLEQGANVNALSQREHKPKLPGWTPLDYAICGQTMRPKQNFDEVIHLLISHGGQAVVMQHRMAALEQMLMATPAVGQANAKSGTP